MRMHTNHTGWPFPLAVPAARNHRAEGFRGFVLAGSAPVAAVAGFYGLEIAAVHREKSIADYLCAHTHGFPLTGDRVPLGGVELVVLKKSGRLVELAGLDFGRTTTAMRKPAHAALTQ